MMILDPDWSRSSRYDEEYRKQVLDVQLNCKTVDDELYFAKKYGKTRQWAKSIRLGLRWAKQRS